MGCGTAEGGCHTASGLGENQPAQLPSNPAGRKKRSLCAASLGQLPLLVAFRPPPACVFQASGRLSGIAGALELSNACSEFAVADRNGGTGLKAELVLPGKW